MLPQGSGGDHRQLTLVRLADIVENVASAAYVSLDKALSKDIVSNHGGKNERLLKVLHETKQKLFRLDILLQWCHKARASVQCKRVIDICQQDGDSMVAAADQLAYLHSELLHTAAPLFDVPVAHRILVEHDFALLPGVVWEELHVTRKMPWKKNDTKSDEVMSRIRFALKDKIAREKVPNGVVIECRKEDAVVVLRHALRQYEAELCLVPAPREDVVRMKWSQQISTAEVDSGKANGGDGCKEEEDQFLQWRWRVLSIKILPLVTESPISQTALSVLRQNIEDRMWAAADYQVLEKLGLQNCMHFPRIETITHREKRRKEVAAVVEDKKPIEAESVSHKDSESLMITDQTHALANRSDEEKDLTPTWALSPIHALDSILRLVSGKVAVGVAILDECRKLEADLWKGCLRVGKPPGKEGVRLEFWSSTYFMSHAAILYYRGDGGGDWEHGDEVGSGFDTPGAYLDIIVGKDGDMFPVISPSVGRNIIKPCDICTCIQGGRLDIRGLLFKACRHFALLQLQGIEAMLESLLEADKFHKNSNIQVIGALSYLDQESFEMPTLRLSTCEEEILSVAIHVRTGYPVLSLGSGITDDGLLKSEAREILRKYQSKVNDDIDLLEKRSFGQNEIKGVQYAQSVAGSLLHAWKTLVTKSFLVHKLLDGFTSIKRSAIPKEVTIENELCMEGFSLGTTGSGLHGLLVFSSNPGSLHFQRCAILAYKIEPSKAPIEIIGEEDEKIYLQELMKVDTEEAYSVSGKKRDRGDSHLPRKTIRPKLSKAGKEILKLIEDWGLKRFGELKVGYELGLVGEYDKVGDDDSIARYSIKLPVHLKQCMKLAEVSYAKNDITLTLRDGKCEVKLNHPLFYSWPSSISDSTKNAEFSVSMESENIREMTVEIQSDGMRCICPYNEGMTVSHVIASMYRIYACQLFARQLLWGALDDSLSFHGKGFSVVLSSLSLENVHLTIKSDQIVNDKSFETQCILTWKSGTETVGTQSKYQLDLHPAISITPFCLPLFTKSIEERAIEASRKLDRDSMKKFLRTVGPLSSIGCMFQGTVFNPTRQQEAGLAKEAISIVSFAINGSPNSNGIYGEIKLRLQRGNKGLEFLVAMKDANVSVKCTMLPDKTGMLSTAWFTDAWSMLEMETGWKMIKDIATNSVFIESADLDGLHHIFSEALFMV